MINATSESIKILKIESFIKKQIENPKRHFLNFKDESLKVHLIKCLSCLSVMKRNFCLGKKSLKKLLGVAYQS